LPTQPSVASASQIVSIEVTGPDSVASGQSAQFVASIRLADGTTKPAGGLQTLRWSSSKPSILSVTTSGVVTASPSARGEAVITADLSDQPAVRGSREVLGQPAGTYRVAGLVHEADAPTVPVVGARVEVLPESNSAVTDSTGHYLLYGVSPQSTIRIDAPGYHTLDQPLEVTANVTRDFGLNVNGPHLVINGPYTISVDVASPCSLNAGLHHRSYDAILTTTGTLVDVVLTEPRFRLDANGRGSRFQGRVVNGGATFTLEWYGSGYLDNYQYPNLVERLGGDTYLVVEGVATTTGTAAGLDGTLNGDIMLWDSRFPVRAAFPSNGNLGACSGTGFRFRVTPR